MRSKALVEMFVNQIAVTVHDMYLT